MPKNKSVIFVVDEFMYLYPVYEFMYLYTVYMYSYTVSISFSLAAKSSSIFFRYLS